MKRIFQLLLAYRLIGLILLLFFANNSSIFANKLCIQNSDFFKTKTLNYFDSDSLKNAFVIIDSIIIDGINKTKEYVLLHELTFSENDTLIRSKLESKIDISNTNLSNTALFLTTQIQIINLEDNHVLIKILVTERWYVFPKPYFDIVDRNFNVWWVEQNHNFSRTEYGVDLVWYNFTGRHDDFELKTILGYAQKLEAFYNLPQIKPSSNFGVGAFVAYSHNKQIAFTTINNKQLFYENPNFIRSKFRTGLQLNYRKGIYLYHQFEFKYNNNTIDDTIAILNPTYFLNGKTNQQFFSTTYTFTSNHVNDRAYPLIGYFSKFQLAKIGFGSNASINQVNVLLQQNFYYKLLPNIFAAWQIKANINFGKNQPYFNTLSLGFCENLVRGYEYFVIDGQQTYLIKTEVKKQLFNYHFNTLLIHSKQFNNIPFKGYLKIFSDFGYVVDNTYQLQNELTNLLQSSIGIGLDVTTYYDWVFRIEGAYNALGKFGLYLHFALDLSTYENCNLW